MLPPRLPVFNLARVEGLAASDDENAGLIDEKSFEECAGRAEEPARGFQEWSDTRWGLVLAPRIHLFSHFKTLNWDQGVARKNYGEDDKAALWLACLSEWRNRITSREYHQAGSITIRP